MEPWCHDHYQSRLAPPAGMNPAARVSFPILKQSTDKTMQAPLYSRRNFLKSSSAGFGYLALAGMLGQQNVRAQQRINPLAPRDPHLPTKAKRVIFLFMQGAMSQMD